MSPTESPCQIGAEKFAELLSFRTDGKLKVTVYPAGALAPDERELLEGTQTGLIDIAWNSAGNIAGFVKDLQQNLVIGLATPPVGVCLFVVSALSRESFDNVSIASIPFTLDKVGPGLSRPESKPRLVPN